MRFAHDMNRLLPIAIVVSLAPATARALPVSGLGRCGPRHPVRRRAEQACREEGRQARQVSQPGKKGRKPAPRSGNR